MRAPVVEIGVTPILQPSSLFSRWTSCFSLLASGKSFWPIVTCTLSPGELTDGLTGLHRGTLRWLQEQWQPMGEDSPDPVQWT